MDSASFMGTTVCTLFLIALSIGAVDLAVTVGLYVFRKLKK